MKKHFSKLLLFSLLFILFLSSCSSVEEPPGVGEKAEQGYAVCNPIVDALERYHNDKGAYPETLNELTPEYLATVPQEVNNYPIRYDPVEGSFMLAFEYAGPGINVCIYSPEDEWKCSGAY